MANLKLGKLPDRTPVKLNLVLPSELAADLEDYRTVYNERHAASEPLTELVPFMLAAFLAGDREFTRERAARRKAESS